MTEHILEISASPVHLRLHLENLVVEHQGAQLARVPLAEIGAVVVSHTQATITHAAMDGLAGANVALVICNEKHLPSAMLLPLAGNVVQTERFARQASLALSVKKQVWKQVVRAKILAQARALLALHGSDGGLRNIAQTVRAGDSGNAESRAAVRYWGMWLPSQAFGRDPEGSGPNAHLNYGYAVLRAYVARAIVGAGLHPSLGIHHHNRYNPFCLADDLMEPYRPIVDQVVAQLVTVGEDTTDLVPAHKKILLERLAGKFGYEGESRSLSDWMGRVAHSMVKIVMGEGKSLFIPEL